MVIGDVMFISPMLLHKSEPFSDPDFIIEPKLDGIRIIVSKINGNINIYTRHNNDVTSRFPELLEIPIKEDFILDGELICFDPEKNKVDFELCMERFMTKREEKRNMLPINYVVFDILHYDGEDLKNHTLLERKNILESVLKDTTLVSKIRYIREHGEKYFEAIKEIDLEGMVAKHIDSTYVVNHRSKNWVKVINWKYVDVYITSYRKDKLAWICSIEEEGILRYAGILELGTTPADRKAFYQVTKTIIKEETDKIVYLEPKIKARVKIRNWTRNNMLRSPVFVKFVY
jgi:DNA ligase 1